MSSGGARLPPLVADQFLLQGGEIIIVLCKLIEAVARLLRGIGGGAFPALLVQVINPLYICLMVYVLLQYCVDRGKKDFKYIEKVAVSWAEDGITTPKQAQKRATRYDKV